MSGDQLRGGSELVEVNNFLRRNLPVERNGFKGIAVSHRVFNGLAAQMIGDPFPAKDIKSHNAGAPIDMAVPFLVDYFIDHITRCI